eukprot:6293445-Karenia_brevis.AAC.1
MKFGVHAQSNPAGWGERGDALKACWSPGGLLCDESLIGILHWILLNIFPLSSFVSFLTTAFLSAACVSYKRNVLHTGEVREGHAAGHGKPKKIQDNH